MPAMGFLRFILMLMTLFFAHFLGRVLARLKREHLPWTKGLTWILRTCVGIFAVLWTGGMDTLSISTLLLAGASLAAGVGVENRPKKVDEIHLFEDEDRE